MTPLEPDHTMIRQRSPLRLGCAAALFLALGGAAVAADDDYLGMWTGTVSEQDFDQTYSIDLKIFEENGRLFQNSRYGEPLACASGGVVMERGAGMIQFVELITRHREMCSDGSFRVYPNGDGKLIWEWFYPDGAYAARADLVRVEK
jgi:hypothetical protein